MYTLANAKNACLDGSPAREGPLVVAVSGSSGSGKTTTVTGMKAGLAARGVEVVSVHFDDHFRDPSILLRTKEWLTSGADPEEWPQRELAEAVRFSVSSSNIHTVILIEEPFGRARTYARELVDLAIHVEVPANIALARRVARDFVPVEGDMNAPKARDLRLHLSWYMTGGAQAYDKIEDMARSTSDIILDGLACPEILIDQAVDEVSARLNG